MTTKKIVPRFDDMLITEYMIDLGRESVYLRRHRTREGVGWGIWRGELYMMNPKGKWSVPDRRSIPFSYCFETAQDAYDFWHIHRKVTLWE